MSTQTLPALDNSLYPQTCQQQTFGSPQSLLMALLTGSVMPDANAFTKQLLANDVYQEWINFSVFGRYLQRNFAAFYRQTEDSFNVDMPALFRRELMRHAQFLPLEQILFVAGNIPKNARQEKLLTTTVNPATAVIHAQNLSQRMIVNKQQIVLNQIKVASRQVVGFALRHNKRTSERTRNEVLILDFKDLRLVDEKTVEKEILETSRVGASIDINTDTAALLRYYELR